MPLLTTAQKSVKLHLFAETLTPPASYVATGRQAANTVLNILRDETDYIARVSIAGSMGKKSSLGASDFDLVVFCNWEGTPCNFFSCMAKRFGRILDGKRGINVTNRSSIGMCVQFTYHTYNFDLVPAINKVTEQGVKKVLYKKVILYSSLEIQVN
jgi:hypothetical protein